MVRRFNRVLLLAALALLAGCGGAPAPGEAASWSPRLESFPFSGVADPSTGRLRIAAVPEAALQALPEDSNGTPYAAAPNTVEIYGPSVTFPSGGNGYPAGCNGGAAVVMRADVHVTSGFAAQQLRNVYARITSLSAGPTFCTKASAGNFIADLGTYSGLYLYAPLDFGTQAAGANTIASANTRTQTWALNLPSYAPYSFSGDLMAEVIPEAPAMTTSPALGAGNTMVLGGNNGRATFTGTPDNRANGSDPEGFGIARPSTSSAALTLDKCGPYPGTFNPASCAVDQTAAAPGSFQKKFNLTGHNDDAWWWRFRVEHRYRLPGETTDRLISSSVVFNIVP